MKKMHLGIIIVLPLFLASTAEAVPSYRGYSGAPGANGRCASTCHGATGGSIEVTGFPTLYVAGQVYSVSVEHVGGSMIKQFNGSCRVGTGSQNAGLIQAGTSTVTYNVTGETNGIHLTATDLMGGTFSWTAPAAGTGEVRLYIAGHQGAYGGANTQLVLLAQEQTMDVGDGSLADAQFTYPAPNPFREQTVIWCFVPQAAPVLLEIFDSSGRRVEVHTLEQPAGLHEFTWDASGDPSGVYFYRVQTGGYSLIRKLLLSK